MLIKRWWKDRRDSPIFWHQSNAIWKNVKSACETAGVPELGLDVEGNLPSESATTPILLACCDEIYFYRFARQLAISMIQSNMSARIHLHVFEPSPLCIADAEVLESRLGGRVSVSYEAADRNPYRNASAYYFAAGRFAVAGLLAQRNRVPIMVIDVDGVVRHDIGPALSALSKFDIGLIIRKAQPMPWRKILACAVFVNATEEAWLFAARLAMALRLSLATAPSYHIDQITIYYLTEYYRINHLKLGLVELNLSWGDHLFDESSLIWSAKGGRKSDFTKLDLEAARAIAFGRK